MTPTRSTFLRRFSSIAAILGLTILRGTAPLKAAPTEPGGQAAEPAINVHDHGALGDGSIHLVSEWIEQKRFRNLRELQKEYPFVDDVDWTVDEAAFEQAKQALPATGGTIQFPPGHYVANHRPWTIRRDHVRLKGSGQEKTILSTTTRLSDGLVLAGYRHVGWLDHSGQLFPFPAGEGQKGASTLALKDPAWAGEFHPGDLVFIRNGANRYDADYGEFNEVRGVDAKGQLQLTHALARSYALADSNWAGETLEEFVLPAIDGSITVKVRNQGGFFTPPAKLPVFVGDALLEVGSSTPGRIGLVNPGRGNPPAGTRIPAGTKIGKSRAVIKLTQSTRDFRAEGLTIIGRRKALNLSNSYESAFTDCTILREPGKSDVKGGLTIDGDDGRFATFTRCTIKATPAFGMQFARSFGSVKFVACHFIDANVSFTEFNFDCEVRDCVFQIRGSPDLVNAVIAGKSCNDLRFLHNRLEVANLKVVFDGNMDIQSYRRAGGDIVIQGNVISHTNVGKVFALSSRSTVQLQDNTLSSPTEETGP